ncbi:LemA family protein [bacterium]|nr:LemA family protein [bacterium]
MAILFLVFSGLVLLILVSTGIATFNALVSLRNQVERAWANIDVILKQRFDEIPQLIEVLEQFVQHEKSMIRTVMEARAHYGSARSPEEKAKAAGEMAVALRGVFAIGEAYPELKSNANFTQIQTRLSVLEGQLADRRETYNESVTNWNTRIAQFPDLFFASMMNAQSRELFQVSEAERARPSLKMNLGG